MKIIFKFENIEVDPHHMEDIYSMILCNQIYSSLLQYQSDGTVTPDIAKSWEISDDQLEYRFQLNDKKFSDQSPITAFDIEKSLKRIFKIGASISADLQNIQGAEKFLKSRNLDDLAIHALDSNKLIIKLSRPNSILLKQLATPDTSILKLNDQLDLVQPMAFSGPYRIVSVPKEGIISLELWNKNKFTSAKPASHIKIILDKNADIVQSGLNGKVDMVSLSNSNASNIQTLKELEFHQVLSGITHEHFFILDPKKINLDWRKFFFLSFDTSELIAKLKSPNIQPAHGYVPTMLAGSIKESIKPKLDLNFDEKNLSPLNLTIHYMKGWSEETIIDYFKTKWVHPNLKLNFFETEVDNFIKLIKEKNFEGIISPKGLDYPDAMANLSYFKSDIRDNFFLVQDQEVDRLLEICSSSNNKNDSCFYEIQKSIMTHLNVMPLFFGTDRVEFWSKIVKTVPPHPLGIQFLKFDQIELN